MHTFAFLSSGEVIHSAELKKKRSIDLQKASIFGNEYNYRVDIFLNTGYGLYCINTIVWYASEKNIIIENGISVPVERISHIKI